MKDQNRLEQTSIASLTTKESTQIGITVAFVAIVICMDHSKALQLGLHPRIESYVLDLLIILNLKYLTKLGYVNH